MSSQNNLSASQCEAFLNIYAVGEAALASSDLFQEHGLRLYRRADLNGRQADYLISTAEVPVLYVMLNSSHWSRSGVTEDGQLLFLLCRKDMLSGNVNPVLKYLQNMLKEGLFPAASPSDKRVNPIPPEDHARMAKLHMIRRRTGFLWEPTQYGRSLGVIDGWLTADKGRPRHTFCLLPEYQGKLNAAMSWGCMRPGPPQAQLPWEQTLERVSQGLPRSESHAVSVVQAFGAMPLDDYMATYPIALKELRSQLQLSEGATYQEAANKLYQYCTKLDRTDEDDSNEARINLIYMLMNPIWDVMNHMQRPNY